MDTNLLTKRFTAHITVNICVKTFCSIFVHFANYFLRIYIVFIYYILNTPIITRMFDNIKQSVWYSKHTHTHQVYQKQCDIYKINSRNFELNLLRFNQPRPLYRYIENNTQTLCSRAGPFRECKTEY